MPTPPKKFKGSREDDRSKPGRRSGGSGRPFKKDESSDSGSRSSEKRADSGSRPFRKKEWGDKSSGAGSDRPFKKKDWGDKPRSGERKPFKKKAWGDKPSTPGGDRPFKKKEWSDKPRSDERRPFKKKEWGDKPGTSGSDRPFKKKEWGDKPRSDERKPFKKKEWGDKPDTSGSDRPFKKKEWSDKPASKEGEERKPLRRRESGTSASSSEERSPYKKHESSGDRPYKKKEWHEKPYVKGAGRSTEKRTSGTDRDKPAKHYRDKQKSFASPSVASADGLIRLNKYIANAGVCSRREADKLIETGVITVNGKIITELGFKVAPGDEINFGGQVLKKEKSVYVLLNKPKDFITTLDDPEGRKTVLDLIKNATKERVYPVGRLDRNTTGLLLLTNDGEMTKKLTHPRYGVKKIYQVTLDKALAKTDMQKIADGIELEDGPVKADDISYVGDGKDKTEVGIQLHSGRNRVVRRIFETLGYDVVKLDRVYFAGLTKKDLPRGRWRLLTALEISMLKMVPGE